MPVLRFNTFSTGKCTNTILSCGSRKKKRAVVMMVTVVALFVACWAPFHVVHMMVEYSEYLAFSFDGSGPFPARIDRNDCKPAASPWLN